jgi:hypothetical protein
MKRLKCYRVSDYYGNAEVVFAESAGKAKYIAKDSDQFEEAYGWGSSWVTELSVHRLPEGDGEYRGHEIMDWWDPDDRVFLVRELGWYCSEETDLQCDKCPALEYCSRKEEWEEMKNEA